MSRSSKLFDFNSTTKSSSLTSAPVGNLLSNINDQRVVAVPSSSFNGSVVEVHVGGSHGDPTIFFIHKNLAALRSEFFKRATGALWQQDKDHAIALPDDDPDMFSLYLNLVYTKQLATKGSDEWYKLCRLYVLVEKLQDLNAKNQVIDGMHAYFHDVVLNKAPSNMTCVLPAGATQELYEGTSAENKARKLVVDLYADYGYDDWLRESQDELPIDFVFDVATRLLQKRGLTLSGPLINRPATWYHETSSPKEDQAQKDQTLAGSSPSVAGETTVAATTLPKEVEIDCGKQETESKTQVKTAAISTKRSKEKKPTVSQSKTQEKVSDLSFTLGPTGSKRATVEEDTTEVESAACTRPNWRQLYA
ncbi:Nn.00g048410.m01.CDS01 [Neocucurbitaria sp. VM-36]